MDLTTRMKIIGYFIVISLLSASYTSFGQSACSSSNWQSAYVLSANDYPYTSPGTGITVTATLGGGVSTLNNFSYTCGGNTYNCQSPAWWLNNAAQSITLTFSAPVTSFAVIVNGTNNCEEFYFDVGPNQPPANCMVATPLCNQNWTSIPGGLLYTGGPATSNLIVVSNPAGATQYVLTHNGCGAGSRYALVDCWETAASAPPTLTSTMTSVDETCGQCDGTATVTPSGGTPPYTYSWNTAPIQTTQTATGLCAGTYIVTFTDNTGCSSGNDTVTINSSAPQNPPVITPAGPFCTTDPSLNLTVNSPGGTWSGTGITNATNGTFDPNTAGIGIHQIIYNDTGACAGADTINIIVNSAANATITPVGPFCDDEPAFNLTAVDPGGTWSGTGITNTTNGTFNANTAGPGTHTITYAIGGSCGDTQTVNITVNQTMDATITPVGPFCDNEPAFNLTAVDPGGTWSGTGITNATNGTFDANTAGPGTHTITYAIGGMCGDTQTVNITVNQTMDATITPAGPFCMNDPALNLSAVDPGGTWSGTGITNAVNGTFDPNTAGIGTHTITYGIAGMCGDTQTVNITVNAFSDATINAAGPFCSNDPQATLTAADPGGTWSGPGITNTTNGTFNPNTAGAGTHTITYAISGACGDTQTVNITVIQNANATINPVGPFCIVDPSITLTAANPNGTWSGNGITNAGLGTFDPGTAGVGTHTITYTIAGACGDVKTTTITVNAMDDPTVAAAGPFCVSANPVLLNPVTPGGTWSGNGIIDPNAGAFDPGNAGSGTHTITYVTGGVCSSTGTIDIEVNPLPNVQFTADTFGLCLVPTQAFTFTNTTDTTGGMVGNTLWNFGDGNTSSGNIVPHSYSSAGTYTITLTVTSTASAGGCTNSLTKNSYVQVFANPTADFYTDPPITSVFNPTYNFYDQSYNNILGWNWNFGGLGTSTQQNPIFTFPEDTGKYPVSLIVTDGNGCQGSIIQNVIILGEHAIFVPNAFTPDFDGTNDGFFPNGFGISSIGYEFYIFDRWGELIFESHTPYEAWYGDYKGELVPAGVFAWRLVFRDLNGKIHKTNGHVSVVR